MVVLEALEEAASEVALEISGARSVTGAVVLEAKNAASVEMSEAEREPPLGIVFSFVAGCGQITFGAADS